MKRFFLAIVFCFGIVVGFAQEGKTAVDLKNDGNEALRAKNYSGALQLFEKALNKWNSEPQDSAQIELYDMTTDTALVYNMAVSAYQSKSFDKAIKYFDESIAMDYKKETSLLYKAYTYRRLKNDDEYLKTLEEALVVSPDDDKVKSLLATIYLKDANVFYTTGAKILKGAAADVAAAKYKTTDDQYIEAVTKANDEFKKALPILEKALSFDPENAQGQQLKAACEQMLK
ncbi:MAG TPA: hypothetical protein VFC65_12630 [Prolixibacteraceae bacterium]|nr:hypothetical protein [Prolixibacteraceae bacterium]